MSILDNARNRISGLFIPQPVIKMGQPKYFFWIKAAIVVVGIVAVAAIVDDISDVLD